jgi:hypothetical protein
MARIQIKRRRIEKYLDGKNSASGAKEWVKVTNNKLFAGQTIGKEKEQKGRWESTASCQEDNRGTDKNIKLSIDEFEQRLDLQQQFQWYENDGSDKYDDDKDDEKR